MNYFVVGLSIIILLCGLWKLILMAKLNGLSKHNKFDMRIQAPLTISYAIGLPGIMIFLMSTNLSIESLNQEYGFLMFITGVLLILWLPYIVASIYQIAIQLKRIQEIYYVSKKCDDNLALVMSLMLVLPGMIYVSKHMRSVH